MHIDCWSAKSIVVLSKKSIQQLTLNYSKIIIDQLPWSNTSQASILQGHFVITRPFIKPLLFD